MRATPDPLVFNDETDNKVSGVMSIMGGVFFGPRDFACDLLVLKISFRSAEIETEIGDNR